MDVLSLEHHFGKEIETSLQQLFVYFCNNINLGQWQSAKACLKQLDANKKIFKFDFDAILADIIQNPELYNDGSCTLSSPYHLALLLHEFCIQNSYIENRGEFFYDRILFKFLVDASLRDSYIKPDDSVSVCLIVEELINFVRADLFKEPMKVEHKISPPNKKTNSLLLKSSSTSTSLASAESLASATKNPVTPSFELSEATSNFMRLLFLTNPLRAKCLVEIILKYNAEHALNAFLNLHLSAIQRLLEDLDSSRNRRRSSIINPQQVNVELVSHHEFQPEKIKKLLFTLLNTLSMYQIEIKTSTQSENVKHEYGSMLSKCFRMICFKFNKIWSENLDEMDENFRHVYASLLFEYNEIDESKDKNNNKDMHKINLLNFFSKIQYEVERDITTESTFNDPSLPILSLIKQYANLPNKEIYLWRRFFLFCYMENKVLLKSIIDECLELISRNQYDSLALVFSIKEFLNLKPLILLLGISKSQDIHSAKKLIASLCVNSDKGTLINKLGNLLKTHLDFMTWFQQIKP
jgi:hypothetical protein